VDILRRASPEFHDLDGKIGLADDVLLLPLVSQCDAALWDAPDEFRRGGTSLTPKPTRATSPLGMPTSGAGDGI